MSVFKLPELPYEYDALEEVIDTETMIIHHTKHHQTYIDTLNKVLDEYPFLKEYSLEDLASNYFANIPENANKILQNHGGGNFNHSFFWKCMTSKEDSCKESKIFCEEFFKKYGFTLEKIKNEIVSVGAAHFGSGWVWLVYDQKLKNIKIISTFNQDTPMREKHIPFLGIDLWEHSYYLRYKNQRKNFLENWFLIVNWKFVRHNIENILIM